MSLQEPKGGAAFQRYFADGPPEVSYRLAELSGQAIVFIAFWAGLVGGRRRRRRVDLDEKGEAGFTALHLAESWAPPTPRSPNSTHDLPLIHAQAHGNSPTLAEFMNKTGLRLDDRVEILRRMWVLAATAASRGGAFFGARQEHDSA